MKIDAYPLAIALVAVIFCGSGLGPKTILAAALADKNPVTAVLPGTAPYDPVLINRLQEKRRHLDAAYAPRTRHKRHDGWALYTNRLFLETSPYLIQHAHNPVNWFPWGDEAFSAASKLNRPVLLSVGYATCHWCHVMEEESFEDEDIAEYLNANFIAMLKRIKSTYAHNPNHTLTVAQEGDELRSHAQIVPVARGKIALKGQASAYVCIKGVCELPTTSPRQFREQIGNVHLLKPMKSMEPSS